LGFTLYAFFRGDHGPRVHDEDGGATDDEIGDEHDNCGDDNDENADACGFPFPQGRKTQKVLQTPSVIKIKGWRVWQLFSFQIGILKCYYLFSLYRLSGVPSFLVWVVAGAAFAASLFDLYRISAVPSFFVGPPDAVGWAAVAPAFAFLASALLVVAGFLVLAGVVCAVE
jgi:hypothetical protein